MLKSRVRCGKKLERLKVIELDPEPFSDPYDDMDHIMDELRLLVERE